MIAPNLRLARVMAVMAVTVEMMATVATVRVTSKEVSRETSREGNNKAAQRQLQHKATQRQLQHKVAQRQLQHKMVNKLLQPRPDRAISKPLLLKLLKAPRPQLHKAAIINSGETNLVVTKAKVASATLGRDDADNTNGDLADTDSKIDPMRHRGLYYFLGPE